jgi:hypothetical protein
MTTPISIVKISPKSGVTSYINLLILEGDEAIPLLETLNVLEGRNRTLHSVLQADPGRGGNMLAVYFVIGCIFVAILYAAWLGIQSENKE